MSLPNGFSIFIISKNQLLALLIFAMVSFVSFAFQFSSVQFSHSVMSDNLRPHELQHIRTLCPSSTPGVHSDSHPSSQWYHPAISSSVVPFSSCPQSLPASESFPMSQLFAWGGWSIEVSALESVLQKNTQDWSPLEWTGWISLQSKGLSRVLQHHTSKASILWCSAFFIVKLSHPSIRVFSKESVPLHQVAKLLELQLQYQSFQWIFRTGFL